MVKGKPLPRTFDDVANEIKCQINDLNVLITKTEHAILAQKHQEFVLAGGCETCRGRGWVVVWDTSDSLSGCYAEYGPCPMKEKCTATVTGPDPGCEYSKYDSLRNVKPFNFISEPAWKAAVRPIVELRDELQRKFNSIRTKVQRSDKVVVVKGRKVPIGTQGEVFWIGTSKTSPEYGERVGIKGYDNNRQEVVHYCYLVNVARVYEEGK